MTVQNWYEIQQALCKKYSAPFLESHHEDKVGISLSAKEHVYPINGLRIAPENGTTGWFIWGGEGGPSTADDYFKPLHVIHLHEWCPEILPYLGLPPGWRFLIAPNHEDVWFDASLLT
jgi:hypothetical protein